MIYDCFTFYNELDLLEIRLSLLDEAVDRFVLCESPFTFRCQPKPLYFAENADRFARWKDRIHHLVYAGEPNENPWLNEIGQRAFLAHGLQRANVDDLVLIGDVDEIPHPKNAARRPAPGRVLGHRQRFAVGYFNRVIDDEGWIGTRAVRLGDIPAIGTLHDVRRGPADALEIVEGGWHFSSLGGSLVLKEKMHTYSHSELDVPYFSDPLRLEAEFASPREARCLPLEDDAPALLHEPRWAKYVWRQPPPQDGGAAEQLAHAHGCYAYVDPAAPAVGAVTEDGERWAQAGTARFRTAFVGAASTAGAIAPSLPPGSWIVIDGFERLSRRDLAGLRERRLHAVAYARNGRSYEAVESLLHGKPLAPGRTIGIREVRRDLADAGFTIDTCDRVAIRYIFASPHLLPEGRFAFAYHPVNLLSTSTEELMPFLSLAHIVRFSAAGTEPV